MLQQVLHQLKTTKGAINLNDMAQQLGIERSALDGMIEYWVRKGRLKADDVAPAGPHAACSSCASSCPGPQSCPFVLTMPRTYSLTLSTEPTQPAPPPDEPPSTTPAN